MTVSIVSTPESRETLRAQLHRLADTIADNADGVVTWEWETVTNGDRIAYDSGHRMVLITWKVSR